MPHEHGNGDDQVLEGESRLSSQDLKTTDEVAARFVSENDVMAFDSKTFFLFDGKRWKPSDVENIKSMVFEIIPTAALKDRMNYIIANIATRTHVEVDQVLLASRFAYNGDLYLNVENGILYLPSKAEEWRLLPHDKRFFFTEHLAAAYDLDATCPTFDRAFEQILPDPIDREAFLYFGAYVLVPDCRFEQIAICVGNGENGKSTAALCYEAPLGSHLVKHYDMSIICDDKRYALEDLEFGMLNLAREISSKLIGDTALLKGLASGEATQARKPYQNFKRSVTSCKHGFLANHLPHIQGGTRADIRRFFFIAFTQSFPASRRDTGLKDRISAEKDGMFQLMVQRVPALLKMHALPEGGEKSRALSGRSGVRIDPLGSFLDQCTVIGSDQWCYKRDLEKAYRMYLEERGMDAMLAVDTRWYGKIRDQQAASRLLVKVVKYK